MKPKHIILIVKFIIKETICISQEFYKIIKEEFSLFKGNVIKC